jgi:hypothetical protein
MGFFDIGLAQVTNMMAETLAVIEYVGMIGYGQYPGSGQCRLPGLDGLDRAASGKVLEQLVSRSERLHALGALASALLGAGGLEACFPGQDLPHVVRVLVPIQKYHRHAAYWRLADSKAGSKVSAVIHLQ